MIGETISHYRILEKLGEGGMGVVYKAEDMKLKRTVALKFLPSELIQSEEWKKRFLREAQAAAALAHPSICHTYEIDEADNQTFIAMEYIDGTSLKDRLESGPLSIDETLDIVLRVAEGLKHAHKRGIVHRDIKPANIMVCRDDQAKIMDFGLAKLSGKTRLTKTATVMGTVAYMSPEQARGDTLIDHHTDVWSLGALLYEMLTGNLPFDASTDAGVIYKIIHEDHEPLRNLRNDLPAILEQAIDKTLQKDLQSRYEDMDALIRDLEAVKSGGVVSAETPSPSIAVLPFLNMSADPEQEYFCDGLAEDIINALTQLEGLHVVARTSAFFFKGKDVKIHDIGKELNVRTILEGSVRKAGNRVRITAQLVKVDDGYHLWSEKYDRNMEDIFAIQDEISETIVDKLRPRLLGTEKPELRKRQTVDLEAYNLYLKGRWFFNKQTEEDLKRAIEYFERTLEKDPNHAPSYAGLADCYSALPFYGPYQPEQALQKSTEAATKALHLDPDLAEAHVSLGRIMKNFEWDWEKAEKEFRRAIELNPGCASAHHWLANNLVCLTRFEEAIEEVTQALRLDPLSIAINEFSGFAYFFAGRLEQAIETLKRTLEMDPRAANAHAILGLIYSRQSLYEEALSELEKAREISRGLDVLVGPRIAVTHARMGEKDKAEQALAELLERSKKVYVSPYFLADVEFSLGRFDRAFDFLEQAYEGHDNWLQYLKADPKFEILNLRSDPRYIALLKKMNLDT